MTKPLSKEPRAPYEPPFQELTWGEKFERYPASVVWVMLTILFVGLPGTICVLTLFLPESSFIPSLALKGFATASAIPIALLAYGPLILRMPEAMIEAMDSYSSSRSKIFRRLALYLFGPFLFAFIWILFLQGPASELLHVFSPKKEQTLVEEFQSIENSGRSDIVCNGFTWRPSYKVVMSKSFLWPRVVCNISEEDKNAYRLGGTITLQGEVSPYGISYSTYTFSSRRAKR